MLESIINPRNTENSWKMFFVGLVYASLSLLMVKFLFSNDPSISQASGMVVVVFCVMFSLPYMYFITKKEEEVDEHIEGFVHVWDIHKDAIYALMWLFLGFVVAFSFFNIVFHDSNLLNFQVDAYCRINSPGNVENCLSEYLSNPSSITGDAINGKRFLSIISNNVYVMIFTLIFSLIFGAGAIFILVWNASVIAAAIGIFTDHNWSELPIGLARYMIHGIPEIGAYFITALAGGIFGVGAIRNGIRNRKFLRIAENSIIMLFAALVLLVIAAIMEVYLTPIFFH